MQGTLHLFPRDDLPRLLEEPGQQGVLGPDQRGETPSVGDEVGPVRLEEERSRLEGLLESERGGTPPEGEPQEHDPRPAVLEDVVIGALPDARGLRLGVGPAGHHDAGNPGRAWVAREVVDAVEGRQVGHLVVEEHGVGAQARDGQEGAAAVGSLVGEVAAELEFQAGQLAPLLVVVGHDHPRRVRARRPPRGQRRARARRGVADVGHELLDRPGLVEEAVGLGPGGPDAPRRAAGGHRGQNKDGFRVGLAQFSA